jgi:hypothetical protein
VRSIAVLAFRFLVAGNANAYLVAAHKARAWRLARLYDELGDTQQALAELERAYAERESLLTFLRVTPLFGRLRGNPRFAALVEPIGI